MFPQPVRVTFLLFGPRTLLSSLPNNLYDEFHQLSPISALYVYVNGDYGSGYRYPNGSVILLGRTESFDVVTATWIYNSSSSSRSYVLFLAHR